MSTGREDPRISINQLAKYMTSTPSQRRRIIANQKRPQTFMVNWYEYAKNVITPFINAGCTDETPLVAELTRLHDTTPDSDYEETRFRTNAEAIEAFLDTYDQIDFNGLAIVQGANDPPKLTLSSVDVSVRPEFLLAGQYRNRNVTGGLKLYFSKEDSLTDISAPYVAAIVQAYVNSHHTPDGSATRNQQCQVYDVFAGNVHSAPTAITRRFNDLEAACQEIALWWPVV